MVTIALDSMLGSVHPVGLAVRLWLFSVVYLGAARVMLLTIRRQAMRIETLATPTLIVGAGVVGDHLVRRLVAEPSYGLRPVGFLDSDPLPKSGRHDSPFVPVLGGLDDLGEAVDSTGARHVILAFSAEPDQTLVQKVRQCQDRGIEVSLVPRLYEAINERATLDHVGGLPLVSLRPTNPNGWQFAVKHTIDRTCAFIALVMLAPLMLGIAAMVKLTSTGPILFRQRRVGRDGRAFDLLKFRTMVDDTGAAQFDLPDGLAPGGVEGRDRRTPVGRFLRETSLDELPQFLNVLRGEMSLIGPRPERPEFVERFSAEVARYEDRHRVKSGITGWAQVNGLRGQTSIADRVEWDNYYIQNWSLGLDLRIVALTIAEIFRLRG
jgi:exopolysaccharide biosynthesis polyprenyl glycosylphosphotransferase